MVKCSVERWGIFLFVNTNYIIYFCSMTKRIQPNLDDEVHAKLEKEANDNGAKISPYAASILKKHVQKKEQIKHTPKRESNGRQPK